MRIRHMALPFMLFLVLLFAVARVAGAAEVVQPTCALLPDNALGLPASPCYALLEARLLEDPGMAMLERVDIERILKEQQLSMLFSPEGSAARVQAGKLLKADLLILLKASEQSDGKEKSRTLTLAVSETTRGLRLFVRTIPWSNNPEEDVAALQQCVTLALAKHAETITEICAVPPFVSNDLMRQNDALQNGYARLVEQALLDQQGLVVVELAEARALGNEQALAGNGDGITRKLPLYFQGDFRFDGVGENQRVTLHLALCRGTVELGRATGADLQPAKAGAWLLKATSALLGKAAIITVPPADTAVEAKQLYDRSQLFQHIGNWPEALSLLDASLLLAPRQPQALYEAAVVTARLIGKGYDPYGSYANFSRKALQAFDDYRRMADYLARYQAVTGTAQLDPSISRRDRAFSMVDHTFDYIMRYSADHGGKGSEGDAIRQCVYEYLRNERERILAIAEARPEASDYEKLVVALRLTMLMNQSLPLLGESQEQQYALKVRAIIALNAWGENSQVDEIGYCNLSDDSLNGGWLDKLIDEVAKLKGAEDGVKRLCELRDMARNPRVPAPVKPKPSPTPPTPAKDPEIRFQPLPLTAVDTNGRRTSLPYRFWGWIPCGKEVDAIWGPKELYLMKTRDVLTLVFRSPDQFFNFIGVCYDGKYLWLPAAHKKVQADGSTPVVDPYLLVIDPATSERWEFTAKDGLPDMSGIVSTPVRQGTICIVSSTDRTWCAFISLGPDGKKAVDIFHEARLQPDRKLKPAEAALEPKLAFRPNFIGLLGSGAESRIIVGRSFDDLPCYPLLIDPATRAVSVVQADIPMHLLQDSFTAHDGALYWVGRLNAGEQSDRVMRIALPDMNSTPVSPSFPGLFFDTVLFDEQQVYVLGSSPGQWWIADKVEGPFRKLEGKVVGRETFRRIQHSNFYRLIVNPHDDTQTIYAVEFLKPPAP